MNYDLGKGRLRGLSLWQPWAWSLFNAGKDLENRSWDCDFRGWLAIQVSKHWNTREVEQLLESVKEASSLCGRDLGRIPLWELKEQTSHVIGLVYIDDWKPVGQYQSPWAAPEGFAAHVARAVPIRPISCSGKQGLFFLPSDLEETVRDEFVFATARIQETESHAATCVRRVSDGSTGGV